MLFFIFVAVCAILVGLFLLFYLLDEYSVPLLLSILLLACLWALAESVLHIQGYEYHIILQQISN